MFLRTKKHVKIQWCRSGFYHHAMLKVWTEKEHYCSRDPQEPGSSERDEWEGGWGGYMCSRVARSIPGENKHSSLTLLTALLTHEICFSLPFFFTINVKKKIIFILTVSQCKFKVINATQISKFEREGSSSKKSTATPRIFSFSLWFPHKS